jgi:methylated-DNA-[protein]-cysteine S-methyltransferase
MQTIYYNSPVGLLVISGETEYITHIRPVKTKGNETPGWALGKQCVQQLDEYFTKKRTQFDLPLKPQGTVFQQTVWQALQQIPYGQTISYGELAKAISNPKASRAVGGANNRNPIPIIIPCHRVVGANGSLTGYALGLEMKEFLLNLEK